MPQMMWLFLALVIIGAGLVAGYLTAFRDRLYLGLLGGCFLLLSVYVLIPKSAVVVRLAILLIALGVFVWAAVVATRETTARLEVMRQHREARERAFFETLKAAAEKERREREQADRGAGEDGRR